ncbi:hypothetical protein Lal_00027718 [Lupinus albus]|nr:hypothetical protein Lal_00027718 [Lupinus albus]
MFLEAFAKKNHALVDLNHTEKIHSIYIVFLFLTLIILENLNRRMKGETDHGEVKERKASSVIKKRRQMLLLLLLILKVLVFFNLLLFSNSSLGCYFRCRMEATCINNILLCIEVIVRVMLREMWRSRRSIRNHRPVFFFFLLAFGFYVIGVSVQFMIKGRGVVRFLKYKIKYEWEYVIPILKNEANANITSFFNHHPKIN